jgi:CopA family copper-resistance protein
VGESKVGLFAFDYLLYIESVFTDTNINGDKGMGLYDFERSSSRRQFVMGVSCGALALGLPYYRLSAGTAKYSQTPLSTLTGNQFQLNIGYQKVNFTGSERLATTVNGSLPAPTLRWKEGETVHLKVTNHLAHDSSIHWHGIILPTNMDGVPGLSFEGIKPGEIYHYQFKLNQSGTYWYHSHSGFQEQTGVYGAIVIDPKEGESHPVDREFVVVLSDWSDTSPQGLYAILKKQSHYFNFRERTLGDLWQDIKDKGVAQTWNEREMWNQMRMSESDIADVTGHTYTYLMNGVTPENRWTALFKSGERIKLRIINAAAMTIFDVRIPDLEMQVVASDGQSIEPVTIDEFRIGVAETYDVIISPKSDKAYTLFAQSIDRTGFAVGRITPDLSWMPSIPEMAHAPILGHRDMGMAHHDGIDHSTMDHSAMDHSQHQGMEVTQKSGSKRLGKAGFGSTAAIEHGPREQGAHVDMLATSPKSGLQDPGLGLRDHLKRYGRKVLTYADIKNLGPTLDPREPSRELQIYLTGNMSRYLWSMDGVKFADADPIQLKYGERLRITLVNDTMMTHPIHLHGLWSELETGDPKQIPRKHTLLVHPGSTISYLVSADAIGRWAYHCHLLYHMPGMMREVRVS